MSDTIDSTKAIETFQDAEEVLAERLPGYESRPEQQRLARRIEQAMAAGEHLFAEGGTGVGKSLAYLIPSILSGKRVVVSTGTKALQNQLADKDIPFLAENLPVPFTHAVLKGRASYACQAKMVDAGGSGPEAVKVHIKSARDAGDPWNGERETLPDEVAEQVTDLDWRDMTISSDACPGKRACPFGETCFSEQAKAKAKAADVVIVNHALMLTDLKVKQVSPASMLDEYDILVADEAHECFPAGTVVDGAGEIQDVAVGDMVPTFDEQSGVVSTGRVTNVFVSSEPDVLVRVRAGQRIVWATANHPFLTLRGWVRAGLLVSGDSILIHASPTRQKALTSDHHSVRGVRGIVHDLGRSGQEQLQANPAGVLRTGACEAVSVGVPEVGSRIGRIGVGADEGQQSHVQSGDRREDEGSSQRPGSPPSSRWQRQAYDWSPAEVARGVGGGVGGRVRSPQRDRQSGEGVATALQDRPGVASNDACHRGGRSFAQHSCCEGGGCQEGGLVDSVRVDSVEVHERGSEQRLAEVRSDGFVYNIEVEGTHTYFVDGLAVHNCEEWASSMFGTRISPSSVSALTTEVRNWAQSYLVEDDGINTAAKALHGAQVALWEVLEPGRVRGGTLTEHQDEWVALAHGLADFATAVLEVSLDEVAPDDYTKAKARKGILASRAQSLAANFADFITAPFESLVRWVEVEPGKGRFADTKVLKSAPIEVGPILKRMLWDKTPSILASATMSVGGSFRYISQRLGVSADSVIAGTPFDYAKQSGLYVPTDLPAPDAKGRAAWENMSVQRMRELVMASGGRALLLFTSAKQMRNAYAMIADLLPFDCMMQGQEGKSNKKLAAEFAANTTSVLFATRSFFTGFDVQGEALSLVVIDKLPFPVPTEPVTEARCEVIDSRGGSSFSEYTMPVMSLVLQQGFGRLIRHRADRGVVAILDPRLETKGYGKKILSSLPPATRLTSVEQVSHFFKEGSNG